MNGLYRLMGHSEWKKLFGQIANEGLQLPIIGSKEEIPTGTSSIFGIAYKDVEEQGPRKRIYKLRKRGKDTTPRTDVIIGFTIDTEDYWVDLSALKE